MLVTDLLTDTMQRLGEPVAADSPLGQLLTMYLWSLEETRDAAIRLFADGPEGAPGSATLADLLATWKLRLGQPVLDESPLGRLLTAYLWTLEEQ